jgi:hypothetical protein
MKVIKALSALKVTRDEIASCGIDPDKPYLELTLGELFTLASFLEVTASELIDVIG